jgi:hypothetical protein
MSAGPSADAICDTHRILTNEVGVLAYLNGEVESFHGFRVVGPMLCTTDTVTAGNHIRRAEFRYAIGTYVEMKTEFGGGGVCRKGA